MLTLPQQDSGRQNQAGGFGLTEEPLLESSRWRVPAVRPL